MNRWDEIFDQWARWVHSGALVPGGQSILGKLIESHGVITYGGGKGPVLDCIEADVEAAVLRLAAQDQVSADVFRVEYGALGHPADMTQLKRAHRLQISLPTYKRRLKSAREFIVNQVRAKRGMGHV